MSVLKILPHKITFGMWGWEFAIYVLLERYSPSIFFNPIKVWVIYIDCAALFIIHPTRLPSH